MLAAMSLNANISGRKRRPDRALFFPKKWIAFVLLVFLFVPGSGQAQEEEKLKGHFSLSAGLLATEDDFSRAFDMKRRTKIGVVCDATIESWPVSVAVEYFLSWGHSTTEPNVCGLRTDTDVDVYCSELYAGLKKFFTPSTACIRPYLAGGLYSTNVYADISHDEEYDGAVGGWFGVGTYVTVFEYWRLNLEWRRTRARVRLFHNSLEAGGDHFHFAIGYCFPNPHETPE